MDPSNSTCAMAVLQKILGTCYKIEWILNTTTTIVELQKILGTYYKIEWTLLTQLLQWLSYRKFWGLTTKLNGLLSQSITPMADLQKILGACY